MKYLSQKQTPKYFITVYLDKTIYFEYVIDFILDVYI